MRHTFIVILLSLAIIACGDDTTGSVSQTFSLEVQVRASDGTPVEGLTVATWNLSGSLHQMLQDYLSKRAGATAVDFTLPQPSVCWLSSYDLKGRLLQSVLAADTLLAGEYRRVLRPRVERTAGIEVYRYELIAQDVASGAELFRDSKYMTVAEVDQTQLGTGATDANGRYVTKERTIIPGLFDLPVMPALDETGMQVGTFTLDDSLTIRIYDDQGRMLELRRAMADARNAIKVTWDPPPTSYQAVLDLLRWPGGTPKGEPRPGGETFARAFGVQAGSELPESVQLSRSSLATPERSVLPKDGGVQYLSILFSLESELVARKSQLEYTGYDLCLMETGSGGVPLSTE